MKIEVILKPVELHDVLVRNLNAGLRETVCVVFDVLRTTSTFVTALHNGAKEIFPTFAESLVERFKETRPEVLLGGEHDGVKIRAFGRDYDFGNSPREYTPIKVKDKTIVSVTPNGTSALLECSNAKMVLAGSFLNLTATAKFVAQQNSENVLLICAGTGRNLALEDALAAGALCKILSQAKAQVFLSDAAQMALAAYRYAERDLYETVCKSDQARQLLAVPELREDVTFCLQRDVFNLVAELKDVPSWGPALSLRGA
jgi:2-phosphosulfolactate phosphatase